MENRSHKIKLKIPFPSKMVENGQSGGPPGSLSGDYVVADANTDQRNRFFPMLSGGVKRKRVHKAEHRREKHKVVTAPVNIGVSSIPKDVQNISGYEDSEERMVNEEQLKVENHTQYMLGFNNVASKQEEARNTERVHYRQGSLRVKLKPSKCSNFFSNLSENQVKTDNDKINSTSTLSARQDQSSYVDPRSESKAVTSPSNIHTDKSDWFHEKPSSSQPKPLRSLDGLSTPRQMRSGRSREMPGSLHQSEPVESLWKSESQGTRHLEISKGPLKKYHRSFQAAEKKGGCLSQINKEELKAALMVVKKIMSMDAAEPFNSPVDPVALGIPDYFDIIDTPMDLGTICFALEKGEKYRTSKDIFHDIQLVWDNCVKYNRKGDAILDLMRRVKKNFNKYWTAAGLHYESSKRPVQTSTSTGSREKQRNTHHYDFETMEMQQNSEGSEAKADISQRSKGNAMVKKGMKFVIRSSLTKDEPEEKTVVLRNVMQESISAVTDEESGPMRGDSDRLLQEETEQMDLGIKMTHHRRRIHWHKPGCLCAVCVSTRRKLAREGKLPVVTAETRSNVNLSEPLIEEPPEIEVEQEMDKTQEPKENNEDTDIFDERSPYGEEALEVQVEEQQMQENKGQTQEDMEKDLSGKDYCADFKFPLQNTSPSISKMATVLFKTWNWSHSLVHRPSRGCSENPIMAAMSSFRD